MNIKPGMENAGQGDEQAAPDGRYVTVRGICDTDLSTRNVRKKQRYRSK